MNKNFKKFKQKVGQSIIALILVGITTVNSFAFTNLNSNNNISSSNITSSLPASSSAQANSSKIGTITASSVSVRKKASSSSTLLGKLYKDDAIIILGETTYYFKINYKNNTGYVSKKYVVLNSYLTSNNTFKTTSTLNVRTGNDTSYSSLGKLSKGQVIIIKKVCSNGWYIIDFANKMGCISPKYTQKVNDSTKNSDVISIAKVVNCDSLNIRSGASTSYKKLDEILCGESVEVLNNSGSWVKIRYKNLNGYVSTKYLKSETPANEAPVITANNVTINCGDSYNSSMLNIKATDKEDGNLPYISFGDEVNPNKVGTYEITISTSDSGGLSTKKTVTVTVKATNPTVTASNVTINQGASFSNSLIKASAKDCEGTTLTAKIDSSNVNTSTPGTYSVKVSATDKWGNTTTKTITVTVKAIENTPPTITSIDSYTTYVGTTIKKADLNIKATDKEDGDLTDKVEIDSSGVNNMKAGTYDLILTVTDSKGATATKIIKLTYKEKTYDINSSSARQIMQAKMMSLINAHRADNGKPALAESSDLNNTAYVKSKDMADKGYFDHEYNGQMIWEYEDVKKAHGENIAFRGVSFKAVDKATKAELEQLATDLFNQWKNSAGHNASMLDKENTLFGFDCYLVKSGNQYLVYATQEFRMF